MTAERLGILLIEDNPGDARLVRELLRENDLAEARLEQQQRLGPALERLAAGGLDLVLLDLSLPDSRGLDTIQRVRSAAPKVPIVVLTGLTDPGVVLRAVQAGAQDYLIKRELSAELLGRVIHYAVERMQVEEELRHHRQYLEEVVEERTQQYRRAMESAEAANRAKSTFLANMSHELRTPLNAILGFAQLMQRDPGLTDQQRQQLGTIDRSGQHLLALINDVLDISRIEAGKLRLDPQVFDPREVLASITEMVGMRAEKKGLKLEVSVAGVVPSQVRADVGKLRQVLLNLLGNAVKYTERGWIGLRVDALKSAVGVRVNFAVSDTGYGISAQDQERIFDAFVQTDRGARLGDGTGLGLTISNQYVQLMGGRLEVQSTPGKGSEFRFSIEMEEDLEGRVDAGREPRRVVALAPDQPPVRVLVAEDDDDSRMLLRCLLESVGFDVRAVSDGRQAVAELDAWRPAFVWMDMRMPEMDGYEATARIKAARAGRDTVVVALTASAFDEEREKVIAAGCDDFVRKPLDAAELFAVMQRHLGLRYVYADDKAEEPPAVGLGIEDLRGLPEELTAELGKVALELDSEAALNVIRQIETTHPEIAGRLAGMVASYRFDDLIALSEDRRS